MSGNYVDFTLLVGRRKAVAKEIEKHLMKTVGMERKFLKS